MEADREPGVSALLAALIGGIRLVMGWVAASLVTALLVAAPLGASPPQDPAAPLGASQATGESLPWLAGVGARLQLRHTWETPEDRHTTAVQRGRIWARGAAQDRFTYLLQAEVAGSSIRLLDAQLSTPVVGPIHLTVGQGKAPFGRQQLNSSGALSLVDRSLADGRFTPARRAGIKVHGMSSNGRVTWAAGRFEARGVGDDPGISGRSMTAGRIVATPFGPYPAVESALGIPDGPRLALGVAGLTTTEDRGGKAVGLTRWNAETALRAGRVQVVSELFREVPGTSGEAAHLAESSEVERVWPRAWGGYVQMGVLVRSLSHEVVARHSWIRADSLETEERGSQGGRNQGDSFETGIGYTRYLDGHRAKLQGDVHRLRETASGATGTRIRLQVTLTLW